jgi:hypothetical protein
MNKTKKPDPTPYLDSHKYWLQCIVKEDNYAMSLLRDKTMKAIISLTKGDKYLFDEVSQNTAMELLKGSTIATFNGYEEHYQNLIGFYIKIAKNKYNELSRKNKIFEEIPSIMVSSDNPIYRFTNKSTVEFVTKILKKNTNAKTLDFFTKQEDYTNIEIAAILDLKEKDNIEEKEITDAMIAKKIAGWNEEEQQRKEDYVSVTRSQKTSWITKELYKFGELAGYPKIKEYRNYLNIASLYAWKVEDKEEDDKITEQMMEEKVETWNDQEKKRREKNIRAIKTARANNPKQEEFDSLKDILKTLSEITLSTRIKKVIHIFLSPNTQRELLKGDNLMYPKDYYDNFYANIESPVANSKDV